jgi:glycosyltransferase involved in cell wall biosynthesis
MVPDGDASAMATAINRLLDNPAERDRRRTEGLAWASTFTWKRAAELTFEIYEKVLGR